MVGLDACNCVSRPEHVGLSEGKMNLFVTIQRKRMRWQHRRFCDSLAQSIHGFMKGIALSEAVGDVARAKVDNVGLFVFLLQRDIVSMRAELADCSDPDIERMVSLQLSIAIYEGASDLRELLGKDYREAVQQLGMKEDDVKALGRVSKQFSQFLAVHEVFLSKVRNYVAAHRDHDGRAQVRILSELYPEVVLLLAIEFSGLLISVVKWQDEVMKHLIRNKYGIEPT